MRRGNGRRGRGGGIWRRRRRCVMTQRRRRRHYVSRVINNRALLRLGRRKKSSSSDGHEDTAVLMVLAVLRAIAAGVTSKPRRRRRARIGVRFERRLTAEKLTESRIVFVVEAAVGDGRASRAEIHVDRTVADRHVLRARTINAVDVDVTTGAIVPDDQIDVIRGERRRGRIEDQRSRRCDRMSGVTMIVGGTFGTMRRKRRGYDGNPHSSRRRG